MRETLESINPGVRSFVRGEPATVVAGVNTLLKLVSHDASANPTNLATTFDHIIEREDQVKHMSLYKSRRFAYLGFCCASILDALPYLQMLLTETHLENLHTETAKLFIDCEFFLTELKALAYFSHSVTFPLLNCVAVCSQKELCEIFPKLYHDLKNGLTTTLKKYAVSYRHIKITAPNTELDKTLIKLFCEHAADAVKLQCGREYVFFRKSATQRD